MEDDAAQRYTDFADAMETHNNLEVAALFRKMAVIEGKHAHRSWPRWAGPRCPRHARAPHRGRASRRRRPRRATKFTT